MVVRWSWRGCEMVCKVMKCKKMQKKCKKMQKKCKKMQKYLHMSKKSSTFVADLGIVPNRTNKTHRVMKVEKLIFRAEGANRGLVHVFRITKGESHYYEVRRDRKLVSPTSRYWTLSMAMKAAMDVCESDIIKAGWGAML